MILLTPRSIRTKYRILSPRNTNSATNTCVPNEFEPGIGCVLLLGFIFAGLAVLCDEWLVPWLEVIQKRTGMSDDLAGMYMRLCVVRVQVLSLVSPQYFLRLCKGLILQRCVGSSVVWCFQPISTTTNPLPAGVTLVAFGSAAPELMISLASVCSGDENVRHKH